MAVFEGSYKSATDKFDSFTLDLNPKVDTTITGTLTNHTKGYTVELTGTFLPWDNHHSRYLFALSGSFSKADPNTEPPVLWTITSLVGFAEATSPTQQLDSLTLIQSWTTDEPLNHGNSAEAWPSSIGFNRVNAS